MGFNYMSASGTVSLCTATPIYPSFALYSDTGETVITPTPLLSVGTYEAEITPPSDFEYLIYYLTNSNVNISINNNIQYAPDNSNLMSL